jgi:hypothetical protein
MRYIVCIARLEQAVRVFVSGAVSGVVSWCCHDYMGSEAPSHPLPGI